MATTSMRIDRTAHERLKEIAEREQKPIGEVTNEIIESYERQKFRQQMQEDFRALRQDKDTWAKYRAETELWDQTAGDGLENEPPYYDDETEPQWANLSFRKLVTYGMLHLTR